jgi:oligopeptide transport system substrate-binding protein
VKAELFQQQCQNHLGVRASLHLRELSVHFKMVFDGDYNGIADFAFLPTYYDPNPFLDPFLAPSGGNPAGWTDPGYTSMLKDANLTLDAAERMEKLARCEARLLTAMPCLPLYHDVWAYLQKPFVRGLSSNLFDIRAFKYVRIDSKWRAQ